MTQTYQEYKMTDARKVQQHSLQKQSNNYLLNAQSRTTINIMLITCSTVNGDDEPIRVPSSEQIGLDTIELAQKLYPDHEIQTKVFKLREIDFAHCEANYSISGHYCTWPCWISQRMAQLGKADPLTELYYSLVDWCDIVLIATPIRRGNPSSLHQKLIERLNCVQTQLEMYDVELIHDQLAGFIVIGAQDGVQAVIGNMFSFWSQTGFAFAKNPFVGYTAGNYTNADLDEVKNHIARDQGLIASMSHEMISNQIETVLMRRAYQKSLEAVVL